MSETSDPGGYRVATVDRMLARAAFRDGIPAADERTIDRLVDRAISLFEAGDVHAARAVLYLATPNPAIAARALHALDVQPPLTTPTTDTPNKPRPGDIPLPATGPSRRLSMAPTQAQAVVCNEVHRDTGGQLRGLYEPVPVLWPPQVCDHSETICPKCLDYWAEDYALALFDHGPDGATAGCTCTTCTTTNPHHTTAPHQPGPTGPTPTTPPAPTTTSEQPRPAITPQPAPPR